MQVLPHKELPKHLLLRGHDYIRNGRITYCPAELCTGCGQCCRCRC